MTHLETIENELHVVCDGEIIHVFERGTLSRAAYKHMCAWVIANFAPKSNVDELWVQAEKAWDALSPETQAHLFNMSNQEAQCADDIRLGLLATLSEYRGFQFIKDLFADAIRSVKV